MRPSASARWSDSGLAQVGGAGACWSVLGQEYSLALFPHTVEDIRGKVRDICPTVEKLEGIAGRTSLVLKVLLPSSRSSDSDRIERFDHGTTNS